MVFTLGNGKHCFWYGWNLVVVVREETELVDSLLLSCFGRNNECLQEIVHEAQLEFAELGDNMTPVYRTQVNRDSSATWARAPSQRRRLLATVIMNADWQEKFMDDMIAYLRPETQAWHDERGLPCRRGYLFVGPPGTGKTSLCIAAASRFRLPIYVLSLNNITEGDLNHLISNLASRCILLLEDIDTQRFAYTRTPDSDGISTQPPLTLSALLNALDGVIATDGRIVILTTNHRDKLDPALIRPGRVDLEIPFEHPDVDSIARLFLLVYSRHASSDRHAAIPHCPRCPDFPSSPPATDPAAIPETELKALARQFAMSLPEKKYSQARLLTFLKTYPGQPKKAMEIAAEQFKEDVVEPTPVCEQPQKSRKKRSFFK
jgi:chaperone BCS1